MANGNETESRRKVVRTAAHWHWTLTVSIIILSMIVIDVSLTVGQQHAKDRSRSAPHFSGGVVDVSEDILYGACNMSNPQRVETFVPYVDPSDESRVECRCHNKYPECQLSWVDSR